MKILIWNLGYWQHSKYHDEAWNYLCNDLRPDLALLQEVRPPVSAHPSGLGGQAVSLGRAAR